MKVVACVLFNHPFPKNIPALREIYKDKFDDIIFVQPILPSTDPDVITSYRGSYCFHGLVVDAAAKLFEKNADYYVFVQDDVLLNPLLSSEQLIQRLDVPGNGAFISDYWALSGDVQDWSWTSSFLWKLFYPMNVFSGSGVESISSYLPDSSEVRQGLEKKYGLKFGPILFDRDRETVVHDHLGNYEASRAIEKALLEGLFLTARESKYIDPPFPFCCGMSDFFVVDAATFKTMVPLLGIMAAAQTFVEMAIPTALLIAADRVIQSADVGLSVEWLWRQDRTSIAANDVATKFNDNLLLIHPVKLSQGKEQIDKIIARTHALKAMW